MIRLCLAALAVGVLAASCASAPRTTDPVFPAPDAVDLLPIRDTPLELADDEGLKEARSRFIVLPAGAPGRAELRRDLADEYARRITRALASPEERFRAYETLLAQISLWTAGELAVARSEPQRLAAELAPYAAGARAIRASFARSGGDEETTASLYVLTLADPGHKADYLAEIDDIFAYADALAVAEHGAGAENARPIDILQRIVAGAAIPQAVNRLLALYQARQVAFDSHFRQHGPSPEMFSAHGDGVFRTAWHIVRVLAVADRIGEAPALLQPLRGIGTSDRLRRDAERALAHDGTAADWLRLSRAFSDESKRDEPDDSQRSKLQAALAIAGAGAARLAGDAGLLVEAGRNARKLDEVPLAIHLYEQVLERDGKRHEAAEELADLYRMRVSALAFLDQPLAARKQLDVLEAFLARMARELPGKPLETDLAEAYTAMGRGMAGLGQLDEARRFLEKSLAERPTTGALEQLGTIALKRDRAAEAMKYFDRAVAMPARNPIDVYNQAKILRLFGDARREAGLVDEATASYSRALAAWMELDRQLDLPREFKGEMLVELGKAQWALGERSTALTAFETAVDIDRDGDETYSSVVAFLIVRGEYDSALDAYHRALGNHDISDYSKVYLSLWMLAEARRIGQRPDPLAREYLASRRSELWYDYLARFATGQIDRDRLAARATTRGRRAELLYYTAVLGPDKEASAVRDLLRAVLSTNMVLFYEYDMARHWLSEGFEARQRARR